MLAYHYQDNFLLTDPEGTRTQFQYDGNRRLTKRTRQVIRTNGKGKQQNHRQVTLFEYDEADRLTKESVVLPKENYANKDAFLVTEFTYNGLDRLTRKVQKRVIDGEETILDDSNFTYKNQLDATLLATAGNGNQGLEFSYEATPPFAMTQFKNTATNPAIGLIDGTYDVVPDQVGDFASVSKDGTQLYANQYDPAGRLTQVTSTYGGAQAVIDLVRDGYGRKRDVIFTDQAAEVLRGTYTYDLLNRIQALNWATSSNPNKYSQNISYNQQTGNIDQIIRELGTFTYGYDNLDQLTGVDYDGAQDLGAILNDRTFTYDKAGNRVDDTVNGVGSFGKNLVKENLESNFFETMMD